MEANLNKVKVIKWTILYSLIFIIVFAVYIAIETSCVMNNTTYIEGNQEGDISYQSVNSKNESKIVIWNSDLISDRVVRVDDSRKRFKILDDAYSNGKIYFQYSYYSKKDKELYGIGIYDLNSKETKLTDMKGLDVYKWESISEKEGRIFILLNDKSSKVIQEYRIEEKGKVIAELDKEYSYPEGKVILDTKYYNGNINICLNDGTTYYYNETETVKYDDIEESPFSLEENKISKRASELLKKDIFGNILTNKIIIVLVLFVIVGIIIGGLVINKSFVIRLMIWTELAFVLLMVIMLAGFSDRIEKSEINKVVKYGANKLENVSETITESGYTDYEKLYSFNQELEKAFDEIVVFDKASNNMTFVGALNTAYNTELQNEYEKLSIKVDRNNSIFNKRIKYGNAEYMTIVIYDSSNVDSDRVIIGFIEISDVREVVSSVMDDIKSRTLFVFLVINAFILVVFFKYSIGFKKFSNSLLTLVRRRDDFESVKSKAKILSKECGALEEINRIFSNIKYEKNQNCELYNKFIPRDVEKVFGKKSLLDIELGEHVELFGSVATISFDDNGFTSNDIYMKTIENALQIVNENRKKQDGIMVSQDSRISDTKVLFKDDINKAIEFAVDTIHEFDANINVADKQKVIVLNYSKYQCGITGCEERLIPYLFSKEETVILNYIESFRRAGIKLILTEKAIEKANKKYLFRYIGYISEKGKNIKLYECLDAYLPIKRNLLINTQSKFKKALGLFYTNDFYLARNTFNEVLKENPDDRIARWYLFNCENNLNSTIDDDISYGLFENKIFEQQYQI